MLKIAGIGKFPVIDDINFLTYFTDISIETLNPNQILLIQKCIRICFFQYPQISIFPL